LTDAMPAKRPWKLRVRPTSSKRPVCILAKLERHLVRLRAGVEEDDLLKRRREERGEALREREHRLGEHPRVQVDDFVERPFHCGPDARVVVPQRRADLPRSEVENAPTLGRLDPGAFRAGDDERSEAAGVADQIAAGRSRGL
jgi:hypothetical protein